jgi:hypothetical protein
VESGTLSPSVSGPAWAAENPRSPETCQRRVNAAPSGRRIRPGSRTSPAGLSPPLQCSLISESVRASVARSSVPKSRPERAGIKGWSRASAFGRGGGPGRSSKVAPIGWNPSPRPEPERTRRSGPGGSGRVTAPTQRTSRGGTGRAMLPHPFAPPAPGCAGAMVSRRLASPQSTARWTVPDASTVRHPASLAMAMPPGCSSNGPMTPIAKPAARLARRSIIAIHAEAQPDPVGSPRMDARTLAPA